MIYQHLNPEEAEQAGDFLKRYMGLVDATGFCINACGCCDSPWIAKVEESERQPDQSESDGLSPIGRHFEHLDKSIPKEKKP